MKFLKCPLVHLTDAYTRCSVHLPAVVQQMSRWPSSPSREWSCASVGHTATNNQSPATTNNQSPVTTNNQSPVTTNTQSPGCEMCRGHIQATDSHSPTGVQAERKSQHIYHCSTGGVGRVRSAISASPGLVQQAAAHGQGPEFPHSSWYPSVVCSRRFMGPASHAPLSPVVWGLSTSSSVRVSPSIRWYRGHTRSPAWQSSGTGSLDVEESTGDLVDEADIDFYSDNDSDTDMSYQLPAIRHDSSQPGEVVDLATQQDTQEIMSTRVGRRGQLVQRKPADEMTLPELSRSSLNIVPYVKRSVTLQNLVRLGVSLCRIQKVPGVVEYLIKADFDRNIVPQLKFLALVGIEAHMVGHIYTVNPLLFLESVGDLELRVGYLVHKDFGLREVASIVTKDPVVLLMDPIVLDEKLAFLQDLFKLTAHQVREVVKMYPKLLPVKNKILTNMKFHLQEFVGFSNTEVQELLLKCPKVFFCDRDKLVRRFDYLHNHMQISHRQVLASPQVLHTSLFVFKQRHLFLLHRGRAQYDPCQENYVSLQWLSTASDEQFCQTVAKCHLQEFYSFCKTL